jgi:biotin carboxyl carrier protein
VENRIGKNVMKRELLLNGELLSFGVESGPAGFSVNLNGDELHYDCLESDPGQLMIRDGERAYRARVVRVKEQIFVWIDGRTFEFTLPSADGAGAGGEESNKDEVRAPMPGTLIKLMVRPGDEVEEGQTVAVVEAMKMEHNLRAPRAGIVEKTAGTVGQIVDTEAAVVTLVKGN